MGTKLGTKIDGFFTTRFVSAISESDAEAMAVALVRSDVEEVYPKLSWDFIVKEVWEEHERTADEGPGYGFTWFGS